MAAAYVCPNGSPPIGYSKRGRPICATPALKAAPPGSNAAKFLKGMLLRRQALIDALEDPAAMAAYGDPSRLDANLSNVLLDILSEEATQDPTIPMEGGARGKSYKQRGGAWTDYFVTKFWALAAAFPKTSEAISQAVDNVATAAGKIKGFADKTVSANLLVTLMVLIQIAAAFGAPPPYNFLAKWLFKSILASTPSTWGILSSVFGVGGIDIETIGLGMQVMSRVAAVGAVVGVGKVTKDILSKLAAPAMAVGGAMVGAAVRRYNAFITSTAEGATQRAALLVAYFAAQPQIRGAMPPNVGAQADAVVAAAARGAEVPAPDAGQQAALAGEVAAVPEAAAVVAGGAEAPLAGGEEAVVGGVAGVAVAEGGEVRAAPAPGTGVAGGGSAGGGGGMGGGYRKTRRGRKHRKHHKSSRKHRSRKGRKSRKQH